MSGESTTTRSPEELNLSREISELRDNPGIAYEDLFSSNKMQSSEYPDKQGIRVALDTPLEVAVSSRSDVEQDLMAVLALGEDVAVGIVRARDESGDEVKYLSLLNNNHSDNDGRARLVVELKPGTPVIIRRGMLEKLMGKEGVASGVSGTHCAVELDSSGILTVVDEKSTNGTTVFSNATKGHPSRFRDVGIWSQSSVESKKLIDANREALRVSRASRIGRFVVDQ